jgi:hypothetical protein
LLALFISLLKMYGSKNKTDIQQLVYVMRLCWLADSRIGVEPIAVYTEQHLLMMSSKPA